MKNVVIMRSRREKDEVFVVKNVIVSMPGPSLYSILEKENEQREARYMVDKLVTGFVRRVDEGKEWYSGIWYMCSLASFRKSR